jgi:hypothetical protein
MQDESSFSYLSARIKKNKEYNSNSVISKKLSNIIDQLNNDLEVKSRENNENIRKIEELRIENDRAAKRIKQLEHKVDMKDNAISQYLHQIRRLEEALILSNAENTKLIKQLELSEACRSHTTKELSRIRRLKQEPELL